MRIKTGDEPSLAPSAHGAIVPPDGARSGEGRQGCSYVGGNMASALDGGACSPSPASPTIAQDAFAFSNDCRNAIHDLRHSGDFPPLAGTALAHSMAVTRATTTWAPLGVAAAAAVKGVGWKPRSRGKKTRSSRSCRPTGGGASCGPDRMRRGRAARSLSRLVTGQPDRPATTWPLDRASATPRDTDHGQANLMDAGSSA